VLGSRHMHQACKGNGMPETGVRKALSAVKHIVQSLIDQSTGTSVLRSFEEGHP
jgi:hypothetical protein